MPQNLSWKEAISEVLRTAAEPMHYADIAEQIVEQELREDLGATPLSSVSATIAMSLRDSGTLSPFIRIARGVYGLRPVPGAVPSPVVPIPEATSSDTGVINAFGMFWDRAKVSWGANAKILGQQQASAKEVDFAAQKGVYLLHDSQGVVYVGRVTDQTLGKRLSQHTADRLNGRWTRFSWFGVYRVNEDATLATSSPQTLNMDTVITTLEAVLIEGLEPRQNRKRGDDFQAVEFLQVEDPALVRERKVAVAQELLQSIAQR